MLPRNISKVSNVSEGSAERESNRSPSKSYVQASFPISPKNGMFFLILAAEKLGKQSTNESNDTYKSLVDWIQGRGDETMRSRNREHPGS